MKKRGMLGSVEVTTESYWTEGRDTRALRCNEALCYAEIDCCNEYVVISNSQSELQEQYSRMDMFYLVLKAIEYYAENADLLRRAGVVIGNFISEGRFSLSFNSLDEENRYVVSLIQLMADRVAANEEESENHNFMPWYVDNIINQNYYKTSKGKSQTPELKGVGAVADDDFNKKMKETGPYMLYLVTGTNGEGGGDVKAIARKKMKQNEMLNYLSGCGNNVTKATILKNAEAGIVAKCGMTPAAALEKMKSEARQGTKGLGFVLTATVVSAIIYACVTILAAVISAYAAIKVAKINAQADTQAKVAQPSPSDVENNSPTLSDWAKAADEAEKAAEETKEKMAYMQKSAEDSAWYKQPFVWLSIAGIGILSVATIVFKNRKK